eukprot:3214512-Prymnesium_polylepis.1
MTHSFSHTCVPQALHRSQMTCPPDCTCSCIECTLGYTVTFSFLPGLMKAGDYTGDPTVPYSGLYPS